MSSPISPIVANLYMEAFEVKALNTAPHLPSLWRRFVDDTFVVIQSSHKDSLIKYMNSFDNRIQFTMDTAGMMVPCHFWTHWSYPSQMIVLALQCRENQPTLTCICSGIATIPLQQNTVW